MNKYLISRDGFIHLYNRKKEGLGAYDLNYINAYKKEIKKLNTNRTKTFNERQAA